MVQLLFVCVLLKQSANTCSAQIGFEVSPTMSVYLLLWVENLVVFSLGGILCTLTCMDY